MATIGDLLREVLPSGTLCVAGEAAASRPPISAMVLRLRSGFANLGPGTLALINLELLRQLPARPSLPQAIDTLGRLGGSRHRDAWARRVERIADRLSAGPALVVCPAAAPRQQGGGSFARGGEGHYLSD